MNKLAFGIFAHPDDEAFGPAGTLMKEIDNGAEVQLITLTLGEAGCNPDSVADLRAEREKEWRESGRLIGASKLHSLGYKDGQLTNESMVEIGKKLVDLIRAELMQAPVDTEVEIISIDLNGVTGHIDHIVAGRAACWAYYTLKKADARLRRVRLVCMPRSHAPEPNVDWIYMEAGRLPEEIDEIVDTTAYRDRILAVMRAHHSQRADFEHHMQTFGESIGMNYFKILK